MSAEPQMRSCRIKAERPATVRYLHLRPATAGVPRLALVHALAMSHRQWDELVALARDRFELLLIDCRGHGASDKCEGPYTVELFADDLAAVFDEIGWTDAFLVGCSMGGCVAQAFAARHPRRTRGLTLIDTTASYGESAKPRWRARRDKALTEGLAALAGFQLERWFTDLFRRDNAAAVDRCLSVFLANDPRCYASSCDMLAEVDLQPALARIASPTVIVVGEEDYATPIGMAEALAAGIAGAELIVLPEARHFSPVERPQAILSAIERVVGRARPEPRMATEPTIG